MFLNVFAYFKNYFISPGVLNIYNIYCNDYFRRFKYVEMYICLLVHFCEVKPNSIQHFK